MSVQKTRKLFIMRHGERLDYAFQDWISKCFDESGNYTQTDLNMPDTVPTRPQPHNAYAKDTPLTKIGIFQAQLTGEAFKNAQLDVSHVYCSPSLRCIQTCDAFLKGCNKQNEIKIKVEPGLFEWFAFYPKGLPDWLTPQEIAACGYNIDLDYKALLPIAKSDNNQESCKEYYFRSLFLTKDVLNTHLDGNILFVGHATTLEVCSRELIGKEPRIPLWEIGGTIKAIPYCGFVEVSQKQERWELKGPPFPQLTHTVNLKFDYQKLL